MTSWAILSLISFSKIVFRFGEPACWVSSKLIRLPAHSGLTESYGPLVGAQPYKNKRLLSPITGRPA